MGRYSGDGGEMGGDMAAASSLPTSRARASSSALISLGRISLISRLHLPYISPTSRARAASSALISPAAMACTSRHGGGVAEM